MATARLLYQTIHRAANKLCDCYIVSFRQAFQLNVLLPCERCGHAHRIGGLLTHDFSHSEPLHLAATVVCPRMAEEAMRGRSFDGEWHLLPD